MNHRFTFIFLCVTFGIGSAVLAQNDVPQDVRSFVRGFWFPEDLTELSAHFDTSVTPELITMLESEAEEEYWGIITGMLGAVGDETSVEALISFLEKPTEERLSRDHHYARSSAIRALGYLVYRTGNELALSYLIEGLTPSVWRQRNVTGVAPWTNSCEENDLLLSKYAILGLALSGHQRAGEALRAVQRTPTADQLQFSSAEQSTLKHWLETHALVAERGMEGMREHYETLRLQKALRELEEIHRQRTLRGQDLDRVNDLLEELEEALRLRALREEERVQR